ncbi:MAG: hypothetical protein LBR73_05710 [Oscillospiraceae bacterium]|nr:hypothetical protein [Oscillospiraceae bacterium]
MKKTGKSAVGVLLAALILCAVLPTAGAKSYSGKAPILSSADAMNLTEKNYDIPVDFTYSDSYFDTPSTAYNHNLARISMRIAAASFTAAAATDDPASNWFSDTKAQPNGNCAASKNLDAFWKAIGFKPLSYVGYDDPLLKGGDKAAYSIAERKLPSGSVVLALTIRSGGYMAEWASNFNVGTGWIHNGFLQAALPMMEDLDSRIQVYIDKGIKVKVWITGFSRGAAIANVLAAFIDRQSDGAAQEVQEKNKSYPAKKDIYAYTFATPAATRYADMHDAKYSNIWNILNPVDLVSIVPFPAWGFGRFGNTRILSFQDPTTDSYRKLNAKYTSYFKNIDTGGAEIHLLTQQQYPLIRFLAEGVGLAVPSVYGIGLAVPALVRTIGTVMPSALSFTALDLVFNRNAGGQVLQMIWDGMTASYNHWYSYFPDTAGTFRSPPKTKPRSGKASLDTLAAAWNAMETADTFSVLSFNMFQAAHSKEGYITLLSQPQSTAFASTAPYGLDLLE